MGSAVLLPTRHGTDEGRKKARSHDPNPLVGHHVLCATRSALEFLGFIAMRLSPLDPKERYGQSGTSIRGG
jgi:hypothetical protein